MVKIEPLKYNIICKIYVYSMRMHPCMSTNVICKMKLYKTHRRENVQYYSTSLIDTHTLQQFPVFSLTDACIQTHHIKYHHLKEIISFTSTQNLNNLPFVCQPYLCVVKQTLLELGIHNPNSQVWS